MVLMIKENVVGPVVGVVIAGLMLKILMLLYVVVDENRQFRLLAVFYIY